MPEEELQSNWKAGVGAFRTFHQQAGTTGKNGHIQNCDIVTRADYHVIDINEYDFGTEDDHEQLSSNYNLANKGKYLAVSVIYAISATGKSVLSRVLANNDERSDESESNDVSVNVFHYMN